MPTYDKNARWPKGWRKRQNRFVQEVCDIVADQETCTSSWIPFMDEERGARAVAVWASPRVLMSVEGTGYGAVISTFIPCKTGESVFMRTACFAVDESTRRGLVKEIWGGLSSGRSASLGSETIIGMTRSAQHRYRLEGMIRSIKAAIGAE